jgi:hypothetical protein
MDDKDLNRRMARIKRDVMRGAIGSVLQALDEAASGALLRRLREQKVLFNLRDVATRTAAIGPLRTAAHTVLGGEAVACYENYLEFVPIAAGLLAELTAEATAQLAAFPNIAAMDLLPIAHELLNEQIHAAAEKTRDLKLTLADGQPNPVGEHALHALNGELNEFMFALGRALNEAAKRLPLHRPNRPGAAVRQAAHSALAAFVPLAWEWNTLEYIIDCVSFGDCVIRQIEHSTPPRVHVDFAEPRYVLLRRVGLRRRLRNKLDGRSERTHLREALGTFAEKVVDEATAYYAQQVGRPVMKLPERDQCLADLRAQLHQVDAEDDFLMLAGGDSPEVQATYLAAFGLLAFAQVARAARRYLPPRLMQSLLLMRIPFARLAEYLAAPPIGTEPIQSALRRMCCSLPVERHYDLVRKPFVLEGANAARLFGMGYTGVWTHSVRDELLDGGTRGKTFGAIWERFIEHAFSGSAWTVLCRNPRLKMDGRIATEIDLLLLKDGVLLVVQVKATQGTGVDLYDHWKARQMIELGARQAKLAARILQEDRSRLVSLCSKKVAQGILHIEPVVFTNSYTLNGWQCEGVPVLGLSGQRGLREGAHVDYRDTRTREVRASVEYAPPPGSPQEQILWLLRHSVEAEIAAEDGTVEHEARTLRGVQWLWPELSLGLTPAGQSTPVGATA